MAKKDIKFVPPVEEPKKEETPLFESEAYGSPQPDAGMDTTVTKPVGIGGPVPIVAPKHNTIQLQPIIVPLAVVPYMTQDSDVLRTDAPDERTQYSSYDEHTEFEKTGKAGTASKDKTKKRAKTAKGNKSRAESFVMFILTGILTAAYLLAKFLPDIGGVVHLGELNVIDQLIAWIGGTNPASRLYTCLNAGTAVVAAVTFIVSLVALIAGKSPRVYYAVASLLFTAAPIAVLGVKVARGTFVAADEIGLLIVVGAAALAFIVSIIGLAVGAKKEKSAEEPGRFDSSSEI